ncbi:hypothetical protein D3P96_02785 [Weissella viridescens]|uniref:Phage regulatory protein n=1 Tax=Weissella viridescens TaxID=1629 RepID=A0A3P2RG36_WEIVI|nr:Rha family transcriptional regulator [Weissella viridescens]RRG18231.1 hypothetical protein D3P96_02785 [Weissella viridescens]
MNNVIIIENGEPMTTSLEVASKFEKNHYDVMRAVDNVIKGLSKIADTPDVTNYFEETKYINEQNHQEYRMFKMTKNGFMLLAMGFTDKKFTEIKVNYIEQFDAMQKQLEQQAQQQFFQVETPEQQTKRITAEAYKMQVENGRMKEFRLAMKQADKLERNDLAELLLEKEVETFLGQPIKQALPIAHTPDLSEFYLTATNIAERFGLTPTKVGMIANRTGLREGVDRIQDEDERWFYTDGAVEKMRARLEYNNEQRIN